jgi:hypothetical protein
MQIEWSVVPRGDVHPSDSRVYVTMNRKGEIVLNGTAYRRMGEPAAFLLMYNQPNSLIALKPTAASIKNAYPARKHGRRNGRVVRALRLLIDNNIKLPDTIEFKDAEIDPDGVLMLDLRTARVSPRAHSQCRKK